MKRKNLIIKCKKIMAVFLSSTIIFSFMPHNCGNVVVANADSSVGEEATVVVSSQGHQIKNIIYMIPDGAGLPAFDVAAAVKKAGGMKAAYGQNGFNGTLVDNSNSYMYMEDYLVGTCTTNSKSKDVTDSAAAATALATGNKTSNSYVGLDSNYIPKASILEVAQLENKSTGIIVTSYSGDATPGAFSAHVTSRNSHKKITKQQWYKGINIVLGAGINKNESDFSTRVSGQGGILVGTEEELHKATREWSEDKVIWSTFAPYEYGLPYDFANGVTSYSSIAKVSTPTLSEMTEDAIDFLSQDPDGFFLMIEGSKIDHAGHHGNLSESVSDYIEFDEAFKVAVDFAKSRTDTIVIAVPDHNTGFVETPSSTEMKEIISKVQTSTPYNSIRCNDLIKMSDKPAGQEYLHTSMPVGVYIYKPDGIDMLEGLSKSTIRNSSERNNYQIDNIDIAPYLVSLFSDRTLESATDELFVSVPKDNFTVKSQDEIVLKGTLGEATAYVDKDKALINGKTVDLGGKINLYIDGKCYISKELAQMIGLELGTDFEGEGTKANPFVIDSEKSFLTFTKRLYSGESYSGKYFKQTCNIDMSKYDSSVYCGIGKEGTFYGNYNGQGYYINVDINSDSSDGTAVFPYTYGTIMNVGITGSIKNTNSTSIAAGLCRSAQSGAVLVNCYVEADVSNENAAAGVSWTIYSGAKVQNCYYKGKINSSNVHGIGYLRDGGKVDTCYYQFEAQSDSENTANTCGISSSDFSAATLNGNAGKAVTNISSITTVDELCKFIDYEGRDFAFEGSVAKASDLLIKYTVKNTGGNTKTISIKELTSFTGSEGSYSVGAPADLDTNEKITFSATPVKTAQSVTVNDVTLNIDSYGFISCEVVVTATQKTSYYITSTRAKYSISMTGEPPTPKPVCNAKLSAAKVKPGESVTITASAEKGTSPYTFNYIIVDKDNSDNMTASGYISSTSMSYKFNNVGTYCIYVSVMDSNKVVGNTCELEVIVKEKDPYELDGDGTKENPYLISTEEQFVTFTNDMLSGDAYSGKYIKQVSDLDMSKISEYKGIGAQTLTDGTVVSFDGRYDGNGHEINVSIEEEISEGIALFPYTTGIIMNLGTTGVIVNKAKSSGCAGIVRSVREGGLIVNCWSTVDLTSEKDAGGIAWTYKSGATAINCYYKGKIVTTNNYAIGIAVSGSCIKNCYYRMESGSTSVSSSTTNLPGGKSATEFLASTLNGYIESVTSYTSLISNTNELCRFADVEGKDFSFVNDSGFVTPIPELVAQNGQIKASWSKVEGATKYRVFTYYAGKFTQIGDTTETSYKISSLTNRENYGVLVLAYNGSEWTSYTKEDIRYATPTSSGVPSTCVRTGNEKLIVNWEAIPGGTQYRIFTYIDGKYTKIADTSSTNYTITGLTNGVTYGVLVTVYSNGEWQPYTIYDIVRVAPVAF